IALIGRRLTEVAGGAAIARGGGSVRGMRHIAALITAIVVGPPAWILLAFGQDRSAEVFADAGLSGTLRTEDFVGPLLLLAGAGLLLGVIVTVRFSPLGATVIG